MASFIYLNQTSKNSKGKVGISTTVFEKLTNDAVKSIKGATLANPKSQTFSLKKIPPIRCVVKNTNNVEMKISLVLSKKDNIPLITEKVQKAVADNLRCVCDSIPLKVDVIVEQVF